MTRLLLSIKRVKLGQNKGAVEIHWDTGHEAQKLGLSEGKLGRLVSLINQRRWGLKAGKQKEEGCPGGRSGSVVPGGKCWWGTFAYLHDSPTSPLGSCRTGLGELWLKTAEDVVGGVKGRPQVKEKEVGLDQASPSLGQLSRETCMPAIPSLTLAAFPTVAFLPKTLFQISVQLIGRSS